MGMGMSVSPQIWQQFIDLVFQDDLIKHKQNFDVIMDDTFIHLTAEEHMDDLMDLFKVLRKYGLKLSPHKCQFFKKKIVYMGLEFQIQEDNVCYTPLKDKCDAIRNLESPKCYIVGLGLNCKFIDLLFKHSFIIFIKISLYFNFIVLEIISKQTDTLN